MRNCKDPTGASSRSGVICVFSMENCIVLQVDLMLIPIGAGMHFASVSLSCRRSSFSHGGLLHTCRCEMNAIAIGRIVPSTGINDHNGPMNNLKSICKLFETAALIIIISRPIRLIGPSVVTKDTVLPSLCSKSPH